MRDEIADGLECHLKVISAIIRYYKWCHCLCLKNTAYVRSQITTIGRHT